MRPDPMKCSRSWNHNVSLLLYNLLNGILSLFDKPVYFLIPKALSSIQIHFELSFKLSSELFNIFEFHSVPLWGVWTVVYVDGTHVDIFLMATGPDAFDLEIKLRKRTSRDLMVQIAQKVKLLFKANKCPISFFPDIIKQYSIWINQKLTFGIKINTKKYFLAFNSLLKRSSIDVKFFEFSKALNKIRINFHLIQCILLAKFLISAIITDLHLVRLISHCFWFESIIKSFLNPYVNVVFFIMLSDFGKTYLLAIDSNSILTISKN